MVELILVKKESITYSESVNWCGLGGESPERAQPVGVPIPDRQMISRFNKTIYYSKRTMIQLWKEQTHFSTAFVNLVLEVTSHSFTVQSADPEARREPSPLKQINRLVINCSSSMIIRSGVCGFAIPSKRN